MSLRLKKDSLGPTLDRQLLWIRAHLDIKLSDLYDFVVLLVSEYNWQIVDLREIVMDIKEPMLSNQTHIILSQREAMNEIKVFNHSPNADTFCIQLPGDSFSKVARSVEEACGILLRRGFLVKA